MPQSLRSNWTKVRLASRLCIHVRGLKMSGSLEDAEYERTITALNGLQTNAAVLEEIRKSGERGRRRSTRFGLMPRHLRRVGLKVEDLNQLRAVHITGTKGKGSVAAMVESVLRACGLKTGFFSSPHLLEVRERFRINGRPLTKSQFMKYFWDCYTQLDRSKEECDGSMPPYFSFLTIMAFNLFLKEKVDVAVVEVGIGGTFDSTNVIPKPVVSAITSLGMDHMDVLGDTLDKIAWQKGGICKPGRPAFTLIQPEEPLVALAARAQEMKAKSFQVAPSLSEYPGDLPELGLKGAHQHDNASLAVQVCRTWLQETGNWSEPDDVPSGGPPKTLYGVPFATSFVLPPTFLQGLKSVVWAGRCQAIQKPEITFYLDGGHTPLSIRACAEWFKEEASKEAEGISGSVVRVLLFNTTRRRDSKLFLSHLTDCKLEYALFCPNIMDIEQSNPADQTNLMVTQDGQLERVKLNQQAWTELSLRTNQSGSDGHMTCQDTSPHSLHFDCIGHALQWVLSGRTYTLPTPTTPTPLPTLPPTVSQATHIQLLVTGSLYLVGGVLRALGCSVDDV